MDDARLQQLVTPFYLRMMRSNALEADDAFLSSVARTGRTASTEEVLTLLRSDCFRQICRSGASCYIPPPASTRTYNAANETISPTTAAAINRAGLSGQSVRAKR